MSERRKGKGSHQHILQAAEVQIPSQPPLAQLAKLSGERLMLHHLKALRKHPGPQSQLN
jgi:hypothetical protein